MNLLLEEQAIFDKLNFDRVYPILAAPEQKVAHIKDHVCKALGKLGAAIQMPTNIDVIDDDNEQNLGDTIIRDEVMPDSAIYRTQLINYWNNTTGQIFGEADLSTIKNLSDEDRAFMANKNNVFLTAFFHLGVASSWIAEVLEPLGHGEKVSHVVHNVLFAIDELNVTANILATHFEVDLETVHYSRMEELLGRKLPTSL